MPGTKKPIVQAQGGSTIQSGAPIAEFVPTPEAKSKALRNRVFAFVLWFIAIGCEFAAYMLLKTQPMWVVIALIVADFVFAIGGALLWKAAMRLDPASKKQPMSFFFKNQLGLIMSIIAFLPLILIVLMDKDMDQKQKGIIAGIAAIALVAAGASSVSYNPPSVEQYTEQTALVEQLTGQNSVYWTKSGTHYHLYSDCSSINTDKTAEIFEGTVAQARELKNITLLCKICENKAVKNNDDSRVNETNQLEQEAVDQESIEQAA